MSVARATRGEHSRRRNVSIMVVLLHALRCGTGAVDSTALEMTRDQPAACEDRHWLISSLSRHHRGRVHIEVAPFISN